MRIEAKLSPLHQARVDGFIRLNPERVEPITLLVDTGASYTSLLPDDVLRLEVPWTRLRVSGSTSATATGSIQPRLLYGVEVFLPVTEGGELRLFRIPFDPILVIPPETGYRARKTATYSILGMDVLFTFRRWTFYDDRLVLETGISA